MEPINPLALLGKALLVLGVVLAVVGLLLLFWDRLPLHRIPLGRLPGDLLVERPRFRLYFPWVTCLAVSILLTILFTLFRK